MPRKTHVQAVNVWARYATIGLRSNPPIDCNFNLARKIRQIIVIPKESNPIALTAQLGVARLRQPIGGLASRQSDLIGLIVDQPMRRKGHPAPIEHDQTGTLVSGKGGYCSVIRGFHRDKVDHISRIVTGSDKSDGIECDNEQNDRQNGGEDTSPPLLLHRRPDAYDEGD
jgi:hypothetical protein